MTSSPSQLGLVVCNFPLVEQGKPWCKTGHVLWLWWRFRACPLLTRNTEIYPWAWPSQASFRS